MKTSGRLAVAVSLAVAILGGTGVAAAGPSPAPTLPVTPKEPTTAPSFLVELTPPPTDTEPALGEGRAER